MIMNEQKSEQTTLLVTEYAAEQSVVELQPQPEIAKPAKVVARDFKTAVAAAQDSFLKANPNFAANYVREAQFAMLCLANNPALDKCDPLTIQLAVIQIAATGLSLNPALKLAYLVPRGTKCSLEPSFQGLVSLLCECGTVSAITAHLVREGEPFSWNPAEMRISHEANAFAYKETKLLGAYARIVLPDGTIQFEVMGRDEILDIKERYNKGGGVWLASEGEMFKKTVIRRAVKNIPKRFNSEIAEARISAALQIIDSDAEAVFKEKKVAPPVE